MPQPSRRRLRLVRLILAVLAVALFVIGYQWGNQWQAGRDTASTITGVVLRPSVNLSDWQLQDAQGQPYGAADLAGSWALLGLAPVDTLTGQLTMTRLIEVFNRLADQPRLREQVRLILVTPDRDSAAGQNFQDLLANARVLTGTAEQRVRLQAQLQGPTDPALQENAGTTDPAPTTLYLINPGAVLIALFPPAQSPASIAKDLHQLTAGDRHAR
jgi:hypothetical protein